MEEDSGVESFLLYENSSNSSTLESPSSMEIIPYAVLSLFLLIFIVGIVGNGIVICIVCTQKSMRSDANKYVMSLAIGDLFVIIFCIPVTATAFTHDTWPFDEMTCKASEFIRILSLGISVFTLTVISIVKYYAITNPLGAYSGGNNKWKIYVVLSTIWIFSIILAIPFWYFSFLRMIDEDPTLTFEVCYPYPSELGDSFPQMMVLGSVMIFYLIPLCVMIFFYTLMAIHLLRSIKNFPGQCAGQIRRVQERKKAVTMFFVMTMMFTLCFLPEHVYLVKFYFFPTLMEDFHDFWYILRTTGFVLGYANSCVNPIALIWMSKDFRKYFCQYMFCCGRQPNEDLDRNIRAPEIALHHVHLAQEVV